MDATSAGFIEAMDSDFNSAGALSHLFELVRVINQTRADGASGEELAPAQALLIKLTSALGLSIEKETVSNQTVDGFVDLLIEIRKDLRANKMWALSDKVRDQLAGLGVILEDNKDGTSWHWE